MAERDYPNIVKSYSKKYDISLENLDKLWIKARKEVDKDEDIEFESNRYYATTTRIFKNMVKSEYNIKLESILEDVDLLLENRKDYSRDVNRKVNNIFNNLFAVIFGVSGAFLSIRGIEALLESLQQNKDVINNELIRSGAILLLIGVLASAMSIDTLLRYNIFRKFTTDINLLKNFLDSNEYFLELNECYESAKKETKKICGLKDRECLNVMYNILIENINEHEGIEKKDKKVIISSIENLKGKLKE